MAFDPLSAVAVEAFDPSSAIPHEAASQTPQNSTVSPQAPDTFLGTLSDIAKHGGERLSKLGDQLKTEFTTGPAVQPIFGGAPVPQYAQDDTPVMQYLKATGRFGAGLYNFATTPASLAAAGAAAIGQPELSAALIAAQMAPSAAPMAEQTYKAATGRLPVGESVESGLNLGALLAGGGHGLLKSEPAFRPLSAADAIRASTEAPRAPEVPPVAPPKEPPGTPAPPLEPVAGTESMARFQSEPSPFDLLQEQMRQRAEQFGISPEGIITTPEGTQYASGITSPARVSQLEVRPQVGEEASLRQSGETSAIPPSEAAVAGREDLRPAPESQAPIGAANRVAAAREEAGLLGEEGAPESGVGIGYHESVAEGNDLLDKGVDPYKIASQFQSNGLINRKAMGVMRAHLERLQMENARARGDLEADPQNPELLTKAQDAQDAENSFWRAYQPMKTEWSNIGTGMQEARGISDADLQSQVTAEQAMREALGRELTDSDRVRVSKAVSQVRASNGEVDQAFGKAINEASRRARGPLRDIETLRNDLMNKLKEITC